MLSEPVRKLALWSPAESMANFSLDFLWQGKELWREFSALYTDSRKGMLMERGGKGMIAVASANPDEFPHDRQPTVRILAMPADTNPSGKIFGGWIMAQMDVAGGIIALEYAGGPVLTVAVTSMKFHKPVYVGDLVSCFAQVRKVGATSITVLVEVFTQRAHDGTLETAKVTEAVIVYVAIDNDGAPRKLPEREPNFGRFW